MYDYVTHSKAWNATTEYGERAYDWAQNRSEYNAIKEWVMENKEKVRGYKDRAVEGFEEWASQNS
jgi:hypothetical protein